MNMILNAIASSQIIKVFLIFPQLLGKVIAKPKYIPLCLWAFKQLWWVDSRLKEMALEALKVPADLQPASLNSEITREIRQRAIAIAWTAKIHPLGPKCLHRSLVLHQWLQARGINAQLEIGWGEDMGHAWVTYNGKVLNDRADIAKITPRLMQV
ncbi:hypothetical protein C7B62_12695 [Pleurocapsa sp. CCALA 161]|uniref:lasso peptide biosynthesis B2 protein n=1 Tax=Pleurocapsa sp. CCALA 161 TaxID=2107688 RepID=UPI000D0734D0|nr:lasso peptide biosynthesis B2 protein [Pleurocapsa sp. CCALA 161]PSB09545.1 hypothetical protein C7B62_12695 [Pleurocapsa sp. CCALA 161]